MDPRGIMPLGLALFGGSDAAAQAKGAELVLQALGADPSLRGSAPLRDFLPRIAERAAAGDGNAAFLLASALGGDFVDEVDPENIATAVELGAAKTAAAMSGGACGDAMQAVGATLSWRLSRKISAGKLALIEAGAVPPLLRLVCEADPRAAMAAGSALRNIAILPEAKRPLAELGVASACVKAMRPEAHPASVMGASKIVLSLVSGARAQLPPDSAEAMSSSAPLETQDMMALALEAGWAESLLALLDAPDHVDTALHGLRAIASRDRLLPGLVSLGLVPRLVAELQRHPAGPGAFEAMGLSGAEAAEAAALAEENKEPGPMDEVSEPGMAAQAAGVMQEREDAVHLMLQWVIAHGDCSAAVLRDEAVLGTLARRVYTTKARRQHAARCILVSADASLVEAARASARAELGISEP